MAIPRQRSRLGEVALAEIGEARKLLDCATDALNRALRASRRLTAIGEAIATRRLLDEAKATIDRAAAMAKS